MSFTVPLVPETGHAGGEENSTLCHPQIPEVHVRGGCDQLQGDNYYTIGQCHHHFFMIILSPGEVGCRWQASPHGHRRDGRVCCCHKKSPGAPQSPGQVLWREGGAGRAGLHRCPGHPGGAPADQGPRPGPRYCQPWLQLLLCPFLGDMKLCCQYIMQRNCDYVTMTIGISVSLYLSVFI